MLPLIFHAVAAVTAMVGEGVARTFVRFRPLEAYRLDILGSSGGIAAFSALSFFDAKLIPFAALASLAGLLTAQSLTSRDLWSSYYRITVGAQTAARTIPVMVNGIPHQAITAAARRPAILYRPYTQTPRNPLNNVQAVGAGTGNDVAGALRMGAKHVDAAARAGRRCAVDSHPRRYQVRQPRAALGARLPRCRVPSRSPRRSTRPVRVPDLRLPS